MPPGLSAARGQPWPRVPKPGDQLWLVDLADAGGRGAHISAWEWARPGGPPAPAWHEPALDRRGTAGASGPGRALGLLRDQRLVVPAPRPDRHPPGSEQVQVAGLGAFASGLNVATKHPTQILNAVLSIP